MDSRENLARRMYVVYLAFKAYQRCMQTKKTIKRLKRERRNYTPQQLNNSETRSIINQSDCNISIKNEATSTFSEDNATHDVDDSADIEVLKPTCISLGSFKTLLRILEDKLYRCSRRQPIAPKTRLLMTISFLSEGSSMQTLALSNQIGLSTARKVILETLTTIREELFEAYVGMPNRNEWLSISKSFHENTGLPYCLGAINFKKINVVLPLNTKTDKDILYKARYSVSLSVSCDPNYRITFASVGANECQENGLCAFPDKILTFADKVVKTLEKPDEKRFYFVGNQDFPLKENLISEISGEIKSEPEMINFNEKLSNVRLYTENCFNILAKRWKVLKNRITVSPDNVEKIVLSTIALHNFLLFESDVEYFDFNSIEKCDEVLYNVDAETALDEYSVMPTNIVTTAAIERRQNLINSL